MADPKTSLSDEQKKQAIAWLEEKGAVGRPCWSCQKGPFIIADHMTSAAVFHPDGGLSIGGASYPMMMVICENCGHTRMFSAMMAGLVSKKKDEQDGST